MTKDMGEDIRVTVVATGLGQAQAKRQNFEVINSASRLNQATGTDGRFAHGPNIDYSSLDQVPAIVRKGRSATVEALANSGVDRYDIPAFLRNRPTRPGRRLTPLRDWRIPGQASLC
jgi:cell division protein FtsZ